ncbi:hypothetical protein, partial [Streptomyces luteogriseus]|uniref:hypothetical protein n=1 Tax=Streptomyces luteogriseus TaxID=68233 RepID=UPI00380DD420
MPFGRSARDEVVLAAGCRLTDLLVGDACGPVAVPRSVAAPGGRAALGCRAPRLGAGGRARLPFGRSARDEVVLAA